MNLLEIPTLLSGQEHLFVGSTSPHQLEAPSVYIPEQVLLGTTARMVHQMRQSHDGFISGLTGFLIGVKDDLIFSVEDLHLRGKKVGQTVRDAKVLGIFTPERRIITLEGRDLDQEYRKALQERQANGDHNYFLR